MKYLVLIACLVFTVKGFTEEAEEGKKGRVGPGKAVVEASEKEGLKLSEKALKNLELEFLKISDKSTIVVPVSSLVRFQDFAAVYRERAGWYKMVEIEPVIHGASAHFVSKDILPGDRIVTKNPGLIRVIDLDVFGPEADACAD